MDCANNIVRSYSAVGCSGAITSNFTLNQCLSSGFGYYQQFSCGTYDTDNLATIQSYVNDATCQASAYASGFVVQDNVCTSTSSPSSTAKYTTGGVNVTATIYSGSACAGAPIKTGSYIKNACAFESIVVFNGASISIYVKPSSGVPWVSAGTTTGSNATNITTQYYTDAACATSSVLATSTFAAGTCQPETRRLGSASTTSKFTVAADGNITAATYSGTACDEPALQTSKLVQGACTAWGVGIVNGTSVPTYIRAFVGNNVWTAAPTRAPSSSSRVVMNAVVGVVVALVVAKVW